MDAFKGTYADWKLVKTRGVVQVVFEVPLHEADAAYGVLGGMPTPSKERWFGIAPLATEKSAPAQDNPRRDWRDLPPAQQAGIRCGEAPFAVFLKEEFSADWHESQDAAACVRLICGVTSRSELGSNQKARVLWHQLNTKYEAWKTMEHA